jgi:streptogramin lyase
MRSDTPTRRHLVAIAVLLSTTVLAACAGNPSAIAPFPRSQAAGRVLPGPASGHLGATEPDPVSIEYFAGISPNSTPRGIAKGPGGTWFTQPGTNQIGHINASGVVKEFSSLAPGTNPNNIVEGSDGNLWFTEAGDRVGRITPRGGFKDYATGNEAYGPFDIAAGADGNLWFSFRSPSTNAIGRITTSGAVTLFTNGLTPGDPAVHDITNGPDGNMWFTEEFSNKIGKITPSGVITEYSAGISQNANLVDITAGADGNLWFTEFGLGKIGRITPSGNVTEYSAGITPGSNPGVIASAEGAVWFIEFGAGRLGKISTHGKITEYSILGPSDSDIVEGPASDLWITDFSGNGIVRVIE